MGIVNGTPGTSINASATVTPDGDEITEGESENPIESILNDLATIREGDVTIAGIKTFSGDVVVQGDLDGQDATFQGDVIIQGDLSAGIVLFQQQATAAENVVGTGSFVDSTVNVLTFSGCRVGDVVEVHFSGAYTCANAATLQVFIYQDYGGGGQTLNALTTAMSCSVLGTTAAAFSMHAARRLNVAGTVRVLLRWNATAAAALTVAFTVGETDHGGSFFAVRHAIG